MLPDRVIFTTFALLKTFTHERHCLCTRAADGKKGISGFQARGQYHRQLQDH